MKRKLIIIIATSILCILNTPVFAEVRYTVTDMGTLGGDISNAYGINNLGQVVGGASTIDGTHAFRWDPNEINGTTGTIVDLGTLPGKTNSNAYGINNSGYVTGDCDDGLHNIGFIHDGNEMVALSSGGINNVSDVAPKSINELGQIAIQFVFNDDSRRAFRWDPCTPGDTNGAMNDLGTLPCGDWSKVAYGGSINDNSQVCGLSMGGCDYSYTHGFLTQPNAPIAAQNIELWPTGYERDCQARAANNRQHAVGSTKSGSVWSACMWYANLGSRGPDVIIGVFSGGDNADAYGINESDEVVGYSKSSQGNRAFYWSANDGMIDLNDYIRPDSGWTLQYAYGINEIGQIVGYGINPNGHRRGFLLTRECQYALPGDMDDNCKIDFTDIVIIANNWLVDCSKEPLDPDCVLK